MRAKRITSVLLVRIISAAYKRCFSKYPGKIQFLQLQVFILLFLPQGMEWEKKVCVAVMELLWTVRLNNVKSSKTNYWHDLTRKHGIQMFLEELSSAKVSARPIISQFFRIKIVDQCLWATSNSLTRGFSDSSIVKHLPRGILFEKNGMLHFLKSNIHDFACW